VGEPGPDPDVFLVGRDAELARALLVLEGARSDVSSTLLVAGEAGIGKTVLLDRVLAVAREGGFVVLRGAGLPLTSLASPFRTLRGLLSRLPPSVPPPGPRLTPAPQRPEGLDPVEFDRWLDDVAADSPVLLAVEDVHWVDAESLDVLRYVIAGERERPVAVIVTMRTEEVGEGHRLHRWLSDIRRLPRFERIDLAALDRNGTRELVAAVIGGTPHEALTDEVHRRSGGNPYLTCLLVAGVDPSDTELPEDAAKGLEDAVLAGWHDLAPGARKLTSVLAIAGVGLDRMDLTELVDGLLDLSRVAEWLGEAVARAVLDVDDLGRFWFHHPLQAELLEARAYPEDRRAWHEACAVLIRTRLSSGADPARDAARVVAIADHYYAAGMSRKAFDWAVRVATELEGRASLQDVTRALRRAIDLHGVAGVSDPSRADLLWRLRRASEAAGDLQGELDAVEALIDVTSARSDPHIVAELLLRRMHLRHLLGAGDLLLADAENAWDLARRRPGTAGYALALANLAWELAWASRGEEATAHAVSMADEAVAVASANGDPHALANALAARSLAALQAGDITTARDLSHRAYDAAVLSGDHVTIGHTVSTEYNAVGDSGSSPDLRRLLLQRRDEMIARGTPHTWVANLVQVLGEIELEAGDVVAARASIRFILGAPPGPHATLMTLLTAARLAVLTGETRQAVEHLARVDELSPEWVPGRGPGWAEAIKAQVLLANGDPRAAFDTCMRVMRADLPDLAKSERLLPLAAGALADLATAADADGLASQRIELDAEAVELQREFAPAASGISANSPIPVTSPGVRVVNPSDGSLSDPAYRAEHQAFDTWYWAELGRARASSDAIHRWEQAAAQLDEAHLLWEAAYAWMRCAEAHLTEEPGDRRAAATALRNAAERARPLEAAPVLDRVEELAKDARINLTSVTTGGPVPRLEGLTRREREILEYVVAGRTYAEIAAALFISEKTVSSHISNMLRKTGTTNRRALAELARRAR
jgi:DNA-binding CsgD family transcriptional regulator